MVARWSSALTFSSRGSSHVGQKVIGSNLQLQVGAMVARRLLASTFSSRLEPWCPEIHQNQLSAPGRSHGGQVISTNLQLQVGATVARRSSAPTFSSK